MKITGWVHKLGRLTEFYRRAKPVDRTSCSDYRHEIYTRLINGEHRKGGDGGLVCL